MAFAGPRSIEDIESKHAETGGVRLYTDVEQTIKEGAQALDRLIRDIVVEQRRFDFSTPGDLAGRLGSRS